MSVRIILSTFCCAALGRGAKRPVPFRRVDAWAAQQPEGRWTRLTLRAGARGPLRVDALTVRVRTKLDRKNDPEERLVVRRTVAENPEAHSAVHGGVGWHHHGTLALLALWFLGCARRRVGGGTPRR